MAFTFRLLLFPLGPSELLILLIVEDRQGKIVSVMSQLGRDEHKDGEKKKKNWKKVFRYPLEEEFQQSKQYLTGENTCKYHKKFSDIIHVYLGLGFFVGTSLLFLCVCGKRKLTMTKLEGLLRRSIISTKQRKARKTQANLLAPSCHWKAEHNLGRVSLKR